MIKTTKNNVTEVLEKRLAKLVVVKHSQADSYDSDIIIYGNQQKRIDESLRFIDVSDDKTCIIVRRMWEYESNVKLKSYSLPITDMSEEENYYPVSEADYYNGYTTIETLKCEIRNRINVVIKILNFMTSNRVNAIMYEIFCYMKNVIENYKKLLNSKFI